jgi:hypothetical protein
MNPELTPVVRETLSVDRQQPSVADMLQTVIQTGITSENVGALEKMVDLYERMQERDAVKSFTRSFNALQSEMPTIVASSVIPNRGKYERFEDVMHVVGPLLHKNGFTVSFSMDVKEGRVIETCTLRHIDGHEQANSFAVRVGGKADSDTQADCKAATTAKRNALLNCLNIVIRQDCLQDEDDPRLEGDTITKEQAESLAHRLSMVNGDREKFLRLAGAPDFASIKSGKYNTLDDMLRKKEQGAK